MGRGDHPRGQLRFTQVLLDERASMSRTGWPTGPACWAAPASRTRRRRSAPASQRSNAASPIPSGAYAIRCWRWRTSRSPRRPGGASATASSSWSSNLPPSRRRWTSCGLSWTPRHQMRPPWLICWSVCPVFGQRLGEFTQAELRRLFDSLDLMITYDPIRHTARVRITLATVDGTLEDSCTQPVSIRTLNLYLRVRNWRLLRRMRKSAVMAIASSWLAPSGARRSV
jgi:hypothetical protein